MTVVKGSRRAESAQETRRAVIAAATTLFLDRGYVATTIDDIAAAARVSRPTVFSVGSKPQLLALARDVALAGDDAPVAMTQRDSAQRVLHAPDAPRLLELLAEHVAAVQERYGPLDEVLHRAADADPELEALWRRSEEQRRQGAALFVDALAERAPLAVDPDEAVDALWLLMAPDVHTRLVRDRGWPRRRYVAWLARAAGALLVTDRGRTRPAAGRRPAPPAAASRAGP
jgi:AcrR family transcriptional regulator